MLSLATHPNVKAYLKRACRKVWSRKARERISRELLSHLEESVESKIASGQSLEDSVILSLGEMGSCEVLGMRLGAAHRPRLLEFHFLAAAATCIGLVLV